MTTHNGRTADHPIDPLFLARWSPRRFTGEPMADADLLRLFEAARWAPSSSNLQPWRFLYAKRGTPEWALFFDPLADGNKRWAADASVLVAIVSKRTAPVRDSDAVRESYSHSFDTGAAWAYLALQATMAGFATHAMVGFDKERAVDALRIPADYRLECMVAIGRVSADPEAKAQPNGRAPQTSFVRSGPFAP